MVCHVSAPNHCICRMSVNCVIKVADFGLAVTMGSKDYYRQKKEDMIRLPIKWLAPECMQDNIFSEKSDVVSKCQLIQKILSFHIP